MMLEVELYSLKSGCTLAMSMMDVSWTLPAKVNMLQQRQFVRPPNKHFAWLSDCGGVRGMRYHLWRSWGQHSGVTLKNTNWRTKSSSKGIKKIKCYNTMTHFSRTFQYPNPNAPIWFTNIHNTKIF